MKEGTHYQTIDPSLRGTSSSLSPALRKHCTHLFLELVELGDVVEEGGDDGGEQEELFGREVLEGVHDGEVPLDRHRPADREGMGWIAVLAEMHQCSFKGK